jgi:hypothetical protein
LAPIAPTSSNGRTEDFDSSYGGSNPPVGTTFNPLGTLAPPHRRSSSRVQHNLSGECRAKHATRRGEPDVDVREVNDAEAPLALPRHAVPRDGEPAAARGAHACNSDGGADSSGDGDGGGEHSPDVNTRAALSPGRAREFTRLTLDSNGRRRGSRRGQGQPSGSTAGRGRAASSSAARAGRRRTALSLRRPSRARPCTVDIVEGWAGKTRKVTPSPECPAPSPPRIPAL